jgi:hypothetical protein
MIDTATPVPEEIDHNAFEAWARMKGLSLLEGRCAAEGRYQSANTHYAWLAWRASACTFRHPAGVSSVSTEPPAEE